LTDVKKPLKATFFMLFNSCKRLIAVYLCSDKKIVEMVNRLLIQNHEAISEMDSRIMKIRDERRKALALRSTKK
jgi:hypothetical protein